MICATLPPRRERRRATREAQFRATQRLLARRNELGAIERAGIEQHELEAPVFAGWERYFVVRPDLRRSNEGPYLERLVSLLQHVEPCSRDGVVKDRDWRRGGKLRVVAHKLRACDASMYWAMTAKMKRHFVLHAFRRRNPWTRRVEIETVFVLTAPWKLETRVRERWRTHETVYTVNVDAEEAAIARHLYGPSDWAYRHWARHTGDAYRQYDDWRVPPADVRRALADDKGEAP